MPASAVIAFTDQSQVLFSSQVVQTMLPKAGGGYRVYLTSGGVRVLSATSTDLVTWTLEAGVRLSTADTAGVDSSSITSCGVHISTQAGDPYRMYYVGVSSVGYYRILSATSTDGLAWYKESGTRLEVGSGQGFLDSPRPIRVDTAGMRLFYVADSLGGNTPANYRIYSASSTDGGVTLSTEGARLASDQAFQVAVTTLTDGRTRIYYSAPLTGQTTASQVLSAIATDGLSFSKESGARFSTSSASASLTYPVVVRSTEPYRWRMYCAFTPGGSTLPAAGHALAATPVILTMTPATALKTETNVPFTMTGEVFAPAPAVTFNLGASTMTATGVAASSDLQLTGNLNPFNRQTGRYNATVTNPGDFIATMTWALELKVPPGTMSILDNLFRPLKGGSARITVTTYESGRVTLRLYTSDGGLVATLLDTEMPAGDTVVAWDGKTFVGNTVASGVYLLSARAPGLETIEKIVVIK